MSLMIAYLLIMFLALKGVCRKKSINSKRLPSTVEEEDPSVKEERDRIQDDFIQPERIDVIQVNQLVKFYKSRVGDLR